MTVTKVAWKTRKKIGIEVITKMKNNPRIFRCVLCVVKTGNIDEAVYTWKELLEHEHGKKDYHEIEV